MFDKNDVCRKVAQFYPELGVCGIDYDTFYSKARKSWIIVSKKGDHETIHFLENGDLKKCLDDEQCVSLGLEMAQLRED